MVTPDSIKASIDRQADLIALLQSMRDAEQDLFARVPAETREVAGTIGEWSPKDLLAHLGAWRAIEARVIRPALAGQIPISRAADAVASARTAALVDPDGESLTKCLAEIDGQPALRIAAE